jgi:rhodanese-related sulfurtransferase
MPKKIAKKEVENLFRENKTVHLADVRSKEEYDKAHIAEADNISIDRLMEAGYSTDDVIVCICNHGNQRSQQAATFLNERGFENAFYLEGGTAGWLGEQ